MLQPLVPPYGLCEKPYVLNGQQPDAATNAGTTEIDLDQDALFRGIDIQGTYSFAVAAGGTLRPENPFSIIRELRVVAGNGDVLWKVSGYEAFLLAQLARGGLDPIDFDRVPAVTTAVTNGRFIIPIDFTFVGIDPSHAGLIPGRFLNSFKLQIDYASTLTDAIGTSLTGSPTLSCTLAVYKRLIEPAMVSAGGYGSKVVQVNPVSVTATTPGQLVKLEAGMRYAGFLLVNRDGASATLSDTAGFTGLATVYLDSSTLKFKANQTVIRQLTRSRFPTNYKGTMTAFDLTGVNYIDVGQLYAQDNDTMATLMQMLDATQAREVRLELDTTVNSSTVVRVIPLRYRAAAQTAVALALPVM